MNKSWESIQASRTVVKLQFLNLQVRFMYILSLRKSAPIPSSLLFDSGRVLKTRILYLHCGSAESRKAQTRELKSMIKEYGVEVIAIGDGAAARETEILISQIANEREEKIVSRRHCNDNRDILSS